MAALPGGISKVFFFEKKKQKTFTISSRRLGYVRNTDQRFFASRCAAAALF
jgi:hypothetical protein